MEIPDKIFYKIGEVSKLVGVKPYVLRYWETEFGLSVRKSGAGQRLYRRKDVERLILIKRLLHSDGFTIVGARRHLARGLGGAAKRLAEGTPDHLSEEAGKLESEAITQAREPAKIIQDNVPILGALTASREDLEWRRALEEEILALQELVRSARQFKT